MGIGMVYLPKTTPFMDGWIVLDVELEMEVIRVEETAFGDRVVIGRHPEFEELSEDEAIPEYHVIVSVDYRPRTRTRTASWGFERGARGIPLDIKFPENPCVD